MNSRSGSPNRHRAFTGFDFDVSRVSPSGMSQSGHPGVGWSRLGRAQQTDAESELVLFGSQQDGAPDSGKVESCTVLSRSDVANHLAVLTAELLGDASFLQLGRATSVRESFVRGCLLRSVDSTVFCLRFAGVLAGLAVVSPLRDTGQSPGRETRLAALELLCTSARARRRGYGAQLLAWVEQDTRSRVQTRCSGGATNQASCSIFLRVDAVAVVLNYYQGGVAHELDSAGRPVSVVPERRCIGHGYVQADDPCDPGCVERSVYDKDSRTYRLTKCLCGVGNVCQLSPKTRRGLVKKPPRTTGVRPAVVADAQAPARRGRGRPRKYPLPATQAPTSSASRTSVSSTPITASGPPASPPTAIEPTSAFLATVLKKTVLSRPKRTVEVTRRLTLEPTKWSRARLRPRS